jgi:type III secretion system FlhB-like substrate exporter
MTPEFGTLDPEMAEAVATAETMGSSNAPKVVGKGIYLELHTADEMNTTQVLITPEGIDEKGKAVSMAIIYRTISEWSPRRQWRVNFVRPKAEKSAPENTTEMLAEVVKFLERQMMYSSDLTLRNNTPIVFEVSNIDLADVAEWKAPAPALRRLAKARTAVGFPTEFYKNH